MKFGQQIRSLREKDTDWGAYYLNYDDLKDIVEEVIEENEQDGENQGGGDNIASPQSNRASEEFSRRLYSEMERITLFIFEQQGKIANELAACRYQVEQICSDGEQTKHQASAQVTSASNNLIFDRTIGQEHLVAVRDGSTNSNTLAINSSHQNEDIADTIAQLRQRYFEAGRLIIRLYQFVDVNVTGIRKILKKHDKIFNLTLAQQFLRPPAYLMNRLGGSFYGSPRRKSISKQTFSQWGSRMIQPLLNEDFLGALVVSMESGVQSLHQYEFGEYQQPGNTAYRDKVKSQSFNELTGIQFAPQIMNGSRSSVSLTTAMQSETDNVEIMLSQVKAAQRRLRQTSHFVHFLAAPMLVSRQSSDRYGEEHSVTAAQGIEREESRISNWLNLLSTFFYMTNYYIVAPTSGDYARLVGGNSGLASLIIGMTSLAALVSTVLYSWWTSYSYKNALVFASVCSTIGNLLYAAGLPCNSLSLVLFGRLLNGFGSARSINRRYIADTFSTEERTAASAMFVTASAMGMAAGPLLASLIHMVVVRIPNNENNLFLQPENASGWFMFCVWAVFSFCLIAYFQDPPRTWESVLNEYVTVAEQNKENSPLLNKTANASNQVDSTHEKQSSLVRNAPVLLTLLVCFVLKLQVEAVLSAAATLPNIYFSWKPSVVGIYLTCLGLMVLPANYMIGYLAGICEDRDLIVGLLILMVGGGALMLDGLWAYTELQYMIASTMLFVGSTSLEGPNMSLLSKSIPLSWRKGVFNVGLLATEAGTFGRTVADALLAIFGANGADQLLNRTFGSFTLISLGTLALCCQNFHLLFSRERDD